MYNRIRDSSILLTASSQSEHGIRQNPFIYYRKYKCVKFINLSFNTFICNLGGENGY